MASSKRLHAGVMAPPFTATTSTGAPVALADYTGRPLWLAFFRYASCPLCNLRVAGMITRFESYAQRGLEVVAVFQSPPHRLAEFVGRQSPPFPLVADTTEQLYKLFGLESSLRGYVNPANTPLLAQAATMGFVPSPKMDGTKTRLPADFLIDPTGRISDAFYASKIADHIPFDRVERFADAHG